MNLNGKWHMECPERNIDKIVEIPCTIEQHMLEKDYKEFFTFTKKFNFECVENKTHELVFEGLSYYAEIYLNDMEIAKHEGTWNECRIDVSQLLIHGENILKVKIKKATYGKEDEFYVRSTIQGFIPDVGCTFGGIYRDAYIESKSIFGNINNISHYYNESDEIVTLNINTSSICEQMTIEAVVSYEDSIYKYQLTSFANENSVNLADLPIKKWSPDRPFLYTIDVNLIVENKIVDSKIYKMGVRTIKKNGNQILINDEPIHIRGLLHWGFYGDTIAPTDSYEQIKKELTNLKKQGFNMVKHCLYFPSRKYYDLCNEMGVLVWQEMPLWLPTEDQKQIDRVKLQYPQMLNQFINEPSLILCSIGCELDATIPSELLEYLFYIVRNENKEILICDNSGGAECFDGASKTYSDIYDYHFYGEIQDMPSLIQDFTAPYREAKPFLFGEFNDSDTFRIINEKDREEKWYFSQDWEINPLHKIHHEFRDIYASKQEEIFEENNYSLPENIDLEALSYEKSYFVRKNILELTRRYPQITGYNLTVMSDYSITTAGLFDVECNPKNSDEEMLQINNDVILTITPDLGRKWHLGADKPKYIDNHNFIKGENISWHFVISNYSNVKLNNCQLKLSVVDKFDNEVYKQTKIIAKNIDGYEVIEIDNWLFNTDTLNEGKYTVKAQLTNDKTEVCNNQWPIWIYQQRTLTDKISVYDVTNKLDILFEKDEKFVKYDEVNCESILITNHLAPSFLEKVPTSTKIIYLPLNNELFTLVDAPFWREAVQYFPNKKLVDNLNSSGYVDYQYLNVSSNFYIKRTDILSKVENYEGVISRLDARTFVPGEYVFKCNVDSHEVLISTLNHFVGDGKQTNFAENNKFGYILLNELIKLV